MEDVITEQDILDLAWKQRELNFEPGKRRISLLQYQAIRKLLAVIVKAEYPANRSESSRRSGYSRRSE